MLRAVCPLSVRTSLSGPRSEGDSVAAQGDMGSELSCLRRRCQSTARAWGLLCWIRPLSWGHSRHPSRCLVPLWEAGADCQPVSRSRQSCLLLSLTPPSLCTSAVTSGAPRSSHCSRGDPEPAQSRPPGLWGVSSALGVPVEPSLQPPASPRVTLSSVLTHQTRRDTPSSLSLSPGGSSLSHVHGCLWTPQILA